MNRLPLEKRTQIIGLLVEGNSLRATSRLADVSINTVTKLLVEVGRACLEYQDKALRNLPCKLIQCDEIWSFVGAKQEHATPEMKAQGWGDVWTWVAIDPQTKLVPTFMVGGRGSRTAKRFMDDLASRLANRVQLTTDGHKVYMQAVEDAFGSDIDYAMLVKIYGEDASPEKRYSPAECIGCRRVGIVGSPKESLISTSHVERQNLTMRMKMRRFTRLTNAFSKKVQNHVWAIALHYMHYNFCRVHRSLRVTPAMEAGVTEHVWTIGEVVDLLQPSANKPA
ncbi:MAG: IS1 family transposase [Candidatus Acidiferrales bacterium]